MAMIQLTWKQIKNFGLMDKVIEWKGWDSDQLRWRGGLDDDELIEFDDEFQKEEESHVEKGWVTFVLKFEYNQILTDKQKEEVENRLSDIIYNAWNKGHIEPIDVESENFEINLLAEEGGKE